MKSANKLVTELYSKLAPKAIGPYSNATSVNLGNKDMLFLSGLLGLDIETGNLVGDSVEEQTEQVLKLLKDILEDFGSAVCNVASCTVFLTSMDDFAKVNAIYANTFDEHKPARACFAVKDLPKNAKIEISATAFREAASSDV